MEPTNAPTPQNQGSPETGSKDQEVQDSALVTALEKQIEEFSLDSKPSDLEADFTLRDFPFERYGLKLLLLLKTERRLFFGTGQVLRVNLKHI